MFESWIHCIHNRQSNKQIFFSLDLADILLQMEAKPVQMRLHFFDSAVIANSKLDYSILKPWRYEEMKPNQKVNFGAFRDAKKLYLGGGATHLYVKNNRNISSNVIFILRDNDMIYDPCLSLVQTQGPITWSLHMCCTLESTHSRK